MDLPDPEVCKTYRERVVNVAMGELGLHNGDKYMTPRGGNVLASLPPSDWWCGLFVVWVLRRAGLSVDGPAENVCRRFLTPATFPQAGDVFRMGSMQVIGYHFAIVEHVSMTEASCIDGHNHDVAVRRSVWPLEGGIVFSIERLIYESAQGRAFEAPRDLPPRVRPVHPSSPMVRVARFRR